MAELEFRGVGRLRVGSRWQLKMHSHEANNELIIVVCGTERVVTDDGQEYLLKPGDAILYPTRRGHEEYNDEDGSLETIFLSFSGDLGRDFIRVHDTGTRLRDLAHHVFRLNHLESADLGKLRQSYLDVIVGEFILLSQTAKEDILVTRIQGYIHRNLTSAIRVDDLAAIAHMSKYHFIRSYKTLAGITPMEEVRRIRLLEARNLLTTTFLPLKQIADMTGFTDEYMFSKNFKKQFGIPPGSYRLDRSHP